MAFAIGGALIGAGVGIYGAKKASKAANAANAANMASFNQYKPYVDSNLEGGESALGDVLKAGAYTGDTYQGPNAYQLNTANTMGGYGGNMMNSGNAMMNNTGGFGNNANSLYGQYQGMANAAQNDRMGTAIDYASANAGSLVDSAMRDDIDVAPRTILANMLKRLSNLGLSPNFVSELEFYILNETPQSLFDKGFVNLTSKHRTLHPETLMRTSEDEHYLGPLRAHLEAAGVKVEMFKAEYSPSQVEVILQYANGMKAADDHMLLKAAAKEIALQQGLVASFMAKMDHSLGGSSCHIHMSIIDKLGKSAFSAGSDGSESSDIMTHFLAGLTHFVRDIFLLFAPTTNSYKRLRPGTFAPATVTWGEDNRTVAFRLVGKGPARRIENRIPGADVNPYLAYAAMLAAGIRGIEEKLHPLGAAVTGNAYESSDAPTLPQTLDEAVEAFESSTFVRDVFGKNMQDHYANFGRQSILAARMTVTNYERKMLLLDI